MKVAIVGAGHVGLVTSACLAELGDDVLCVDIDKEKIAGLRRGSMPFFEPGLEQLVESHGGRNLRFGTTVSEATAWGEIIFICAGTPSSSDGSADVSAVEAIVRDIASTAHGYCLVVEKSTVPVRTGEAIKEQLKRLGNGDADFDVASVPEFLREGTAVHDTMHPDRIVIGADSDRAVERLRRLFAPILAPVVITDIATAEVIKHASNCFLATKISYINAIAQICDLAGADVTVVAQAMGLDHRIGEAFLDAGIGYGGSCFPKDVTAFTRVAEDLGYRFELLRAVQEINQSQRRSLVEKLRERLGGLSEKRVAVLGLAFKPDTDDVRESPAIDVVRQLLAEGASVSAYDPAGMMNAREALPESISYASDPYTVAKDADALVLLTEWAEFRSLSWSRIAALLRGTVVADGRNVWDPGAVRAAGLQYVGIGRGHQHGPSADNQQD